ncbi:uncharacterized protein LOC141584690 [Saimiri boliviensis]|uniref:uncharacterized protein LOC141584690 n=1 Tax=Saimiri boliviensis TaxID=27679 RepID=UPI003D77CE5F
MALRGLHLILRTKTADGHLLELWPCEGLLDPCVILLPFPPAVFCEPSPQGRGSLGSSALIAVSLMAFDHSFSLAQHFQFSPLCASSNSIQEKAWAFSYGPAPSPLWAAASRGARASPRRPGNKDAPPCPGARPLPWERNSAREPEREAGGGGAAELVGDAIARWRLRGRGMRSERAPPGTVRGCCSPSRRRRRRHCGAASPPATAPRPSLPPRSGPPRPGLQPPRAPAPPARPIGHPTPSEV